MLRANLITWDNGVGLSRDLGLLGQALTDGGMHVTYTRRGRGKLRKLGRPLKIHAQTAWQTLRFGHGKPRFDFNIVLEHIWPEYLPWARRTLFIPNPEWCNRHDVAQLGRIDAVLAKTHETERIFSERRCPTAFIGFSSADRHDPGVPRERSFFHLAGRSQNKGTERLMALWRRHPHWPKLTVVQSSRTAQPGPAAANLQHIVDYLDDAALKRLQNRHRFHLCPSETEGFGHYIVEALSVGALTLTLDAPPMNELVRPEYGVLVAATRIGEQNLAATYTFDESAMIAAIERIIRMDDHQLGHYGAAARNWYQANATSFGERVVNVVSAYA